MNIKYKEWDCIVDLAEYQRGGIAIQLIDEEDGCPVATATVWIPGLQNGEVAIKDYSENEGMLDAMVKAGVVKPPHRYVPTGYVNVPVCMLVVN